MENGFRLQTSLLSDGPIPFDVTLLEAAAPCRVVLFAAGRGGNPLRHLPLLRCLAEQRCTVIAPHFEQLASPIPAEEELHSRARRLDVAVRSLAPAALPIAGVGHSMGAAMLLMLAGGQAWTLARKQILLESGISFDKLALFAPPTDFFRAPGALDAVHTPILVWAGSMDVITPPAQAEFLRDVLGARVEVRVVDGAGHFTFMNEPPPHVVDPHPDRNAVLASLAAEVGQFITT